MDANDIIDEVKAAGVDIVFQNPCDRMKDLFFHFPRAIRTIDLTREEDGVGLSAGTVLAGDRPLVAIQSSGLGNMFNAILSLTVTYGLPLPILASWRGGVTETIPAQVPFNRALPRLLSAAGIPYTIIEDPDDTAPINSALVQAFRENLPHVILVPPECYTPSEKPCGKKVEEPVVCRREPSMTPLVYERRWETPGMTRLDAIRTIALNLEGEIVISNIGIPSRELYMVRDRPENFYMLGSYTQASAIGLGFAIAEKRRHVVVLDGDGSLLGSSVLPLVGDVAPSNLTIIALDNGVFGSTGNQPRPGLETADIRLIAIGSGISHTHVVHDQKELSDAYVESLSRGPTLIHARVLPGHGEVPFIHLQPEEIKARCIRAIRGLGK